MIACSALKVTSERCKLARDVVALAEMDDPLRSVSQNVRLSDLLAVPIRP